jgi:protein subunit release factor B
MRATIVTVSSGFGPVEVRKFVASLAAEIERQLVMLGGYVPEVVVHGDQDAPRSVDLWVYDASRIELALGTHELRCRPATRGKRSRTRWFASVFAAPVDDRSDECRLDLSHVTIQACRAGGPGGQHVNKTSSAVRVIHHPTGITVRAQTERCQHANRDLALKRLRRILAAMAAEAKSAGRETRHRECLRVERGRPVACWTIADGRFRRANENDDAHTPLVRVEGGRRA